MLNQQANEILETLSTALLLTDHNNRLTYINPQAQDLLQISQNSMQSKISECCLAGETLSTAIKKSQSNGNKTVIRQFLLQQPLKKDTFVDVSISPLPDGGSCIELNVVNWHIEASKEEMYRKQQNAMQDFLRGLGHEIKNPLGGMKGAGQLLRRGLNEEQKEYIDVILIEIDRLGKLIDRMGQAPEQKSALLGNIHQPIEQTRLLLESDPDNTLEIIRDYDPSIPELMLCNDLITQALINLGRNAIEAGASKLTLRTRVVHAAKVGLRGLKQAITIDVIDNGRGIPEELGEKILLPLISGRAEGSGFGLSFVQQAAKKHNGQLQYESEPGNTRFSLIISIKGCGS